MILVPGWACLLLATAVAPQHATNPLSTFGVDLAVCPDLDADGVDDLLVADHGDTAVHAFSVRTGTRIATLRGERGRVGFGSELAVLRARGEDGHWILAVRDTAGGISFHERLQEAGRTWAPDGRCAFRSNGLLAVPDCDEDGVEDLLVYSVVCEPPAQAPLEQGELVLVSGARAVAIRALRVPEAGSGRPDFDGVLVDSEVLFPLGTLEGAIGRDVGVRLSQGVFLVPHALEGSGLSYSLPLDPVSIGAGRVGRVMVGRPIAGHDARTRLLLSNHLVVGASPPKLDREQEHWLETWSLSAPTPGAPTVTRRTMDLETIALATCGDVDGDHLDDIVVASRNVGMAAVRVLAASDLRELSRADWVPAPDEPGPGVQPGRRIARTPDLDGDGADDYCVSRWFPGEGPALAVSAFSSRTGKRLRDFAP